MTILCHGQTHVYTVGSLRCQCGQAANGYPQGLSGGVIPPHNPFGPPRPPTPPIAGAAPDVSIAVFKAAQESGASHLAADGEYIYTVRYGKVLQAKWNGSDFGAWLEIAELPVGAVKM